ncbi:MAG: hypothetical protein RMK84_00920 [Oscillochloridaceae bacterium]|nr:hypothetical protein [Chloroflexaceae bacterium]MDW8388659.1 hypothetical protein [Oscillochloridaceae bacterium]
MACCFWSGAIVLALLGVSALTLDPRRVRLSRLSPLRLLRGCFAALLLLIAMLLGSLAWVLR